MLFGDGTLHADEPNVVAKSYLVLGMVGPSTHNDDDFILLTDPASPIQGLGKLSDSESKLGELTQKCELVSVFFSC
jgi:hypothetical protein